jgi:hypothetical protein
VSLLTWTRDRSAWTSCESRAPTSQAAGTAAIRASRWTTAAARRWGSRVPPFPTRARPERLSRILHGLNEVAATHDAPVVVVIDEFQRLEDVEAGSGGLLRRIVQETPDLAYVFAGSIVGLVMELLGPGGPFTPSTGWR